MYRKLITVQNWQTSSKACHKINTVQPDFLVLEPVSEGTVLNLAGFEIRVPQNQYCPAGTSSSACEYGDSIILADFQQNVPQNHYCPAGAPHSACE